MKVMTESIKQDSTDTLGFSDIKESIIMKRGPSVLELRRGGTSL